MQTAHCHTAQCRVLVFACRVSVLRSLSTLNAPIALNHQYDYNRRSSFPTPLLSLSHTHTRTHSLTHSLLHSSLSLSLPPSLLPPSLFLHPLLGPSRWTFLPALYERFGTFSSRNSSRLSSLHGGSGGVAAFTEGGSPSRLPSAHKLSLSDASCASLDATWAVPVGSLEQLYAQAAGVYAMLKAKVEVWAGAKGLFRVKKHCVAQAGASYLPWAVVHADEAKRELVDWAGLKRPTRAVEKLLRSYGNRVEKLLDICRQCIVFESTHDLAACIRDIAADGDVVLVAAKNRLSVDYDDRETAGYRDVNLNLRFQTEAAWRLGVELHVFEVQLLLRSFAELKSDRGHARYVKFRNDRAL